MANTVYIATSLDGFIATRDGSLDWLINLPNPSGTDFGYAEFIEDIDAIVMGRNTFEKVSDLTDNWPYEKPVFVLSTGLNPVTTSLPRNVEIVNKRPKELVNYLRDLGYKNLYIDGGKVIQNFLKEDLIDQLIITRVPVLLGGGFSLFGELEHSLMFRFAGHKVYNDSLVKSYYIRDR